MKIFGGKSKRTETSKLILYASWIAAITLTVICIICTLLCVDITNLVTIAVCAWGELTAAHGFYYWKAKNENRSKHAMQLVKDLADKYGIEHIVNLANTILKD